MRELIQCVEGNLQQYRQILNQLEQNAQPRQQSNPAIKVKELLRILADVEDEVVDFRLKKILKEEHPYLPEIDVEKIRDKNSHRRQSINAIVDSFLRHRNSLLKMLVSLPTENWERTGVHEVEGHVSFKELVRRMVEKDTQVLEELNHFLPNTGH